MEFNAKNESKNPIFYGLIAVVLGIVLIIWGWDKYESTSAIRAQGSTAMMVAGGLSLLAGLTIWFTYNKKKK
jgi:LPXTG-motif cell wall-anchored protein